MSTHFSKSASNHLLQTLGTETRPKGSYFPQRSYVHMGHTSLPSPHFAHNTFASGIVQTEQKGNLLASMYSLVPGYLSTAVYL